jgi:urocanate hydratase
LKALIVIRRDHLGGGSIASPNRKTRQAFCSMSA